jgi:hypothetical protein
MGVHEDLLARIGERQALIAISRRLFHGCPLLAQSRHHDRAETMAAFGGKADVEFEGHHVCF